METFSVLLALCVGNSPVTGEFPSQRPVRRSFDFFISAWINDWVNSREAGDLRRHRAHHDVTAMAICIKTYEDPQDCTHSKCQPLLSLTELHDFYYNDVIMSMMVSQITDVSIVSTICSGIDQRKHQSSASMAFVRGIHRWPVDSPHKRPVTRKMFPFDDVIMTHPLSLSPYFSFYLIHIHSLRFMEDCRISTQRVFQYLGNVHTVLHIPDNLYQHCSFCITRPLGKLICCKNQWWQWIYQFSPFDIPHFSGIVELFSCQIIYRYSCEMHPL